MLLNPHLSDVRSFRDFIQRNKPFNPQDYAAETTGKFDRAYTLKNEGMLESPQNQSKLLTTVYTVGEYVKNKVYGTGADQLQTLFGAFTEQGIRQMARFKKEEDYLFDLHSAYATMEKAFHEQAAVNLESCVNQQNIQQSLVKAFELRHERLPQPGELKLTELFLRNIEAYQIMAKFYTEELELPTHKFKLRIEALVFANDRRRELTKRQYELLNKIDQNKGNSAITPWVEERDALISLLEVIENEFADQFSALKLEAEEYQTPTILQRF